jgi:hypothetical protein
MKVTRMLRLNGAILCFNNKDVPEETVNLNCFVGSGKPGPILIGKEDLKQIGVASVIQLELVCEDNVGKILEFFGKENNSNMDWKALTVCALPTQSIEDSADVSLMPSNTVSVNESVTAKPMLNVSTGILEVAVNTSVVQILCESTRGQMELSHGHVREVIAASCSSMTDDPSQVIIASIHQQCYKLGIESDAGNSHEQHTAAASSTTTMERTILCNDDSWSQLSSPLLRPPPGLPPHPPPPTCTTRTATSRWQSCSAVKPLAQGVVGVLGTYTCVAASQ